MAKRGMGIIAALLCLCLCLAPCAAMAASTADAVEPISPDRVCSLTLRYECDGMVFPDLFVEVYRVAEISGDFQYTLRGDYAPSGLVLNGIRSAGEWDVVRSTLESHILANGISADRTELTDEAGQVRMEDLAAGMYLVSAVGVMHDGYRYFFDSTLIALPGLGEDGYWQYEISANPKPVVTPPEMPDVEYRVLKLWKGDSAASRPRSIDVEIFRDGVSDHTVTLSAENNWSHSWTAKDDGAKWVVVERNIPDEYTVTVDARETTFLLTNTKTPDPTDPPGTGDTVNLLPYMLVMCASGSLLVILSVWGKKKRA